MIVCNVMKTRVGLFLSFFLEEQEEIQVYIVQFGDLLQLFMISNMIINKSLFIGGFLLFWNFEPIFEY
jgi:hypothetical protein